MRYSPSRMKRWIPITIALLVVLGGHVYFSYWPREREAVVEPDSVPGRLLVAGELPYRVWLPYPHQNLGDLFDAIDDTDAWVASVARLLGSSAVELPRFGPFRVPPARSLTIASDREGGAVLVAVDVYPALRIIARLAGRIARNPLLEGGAVELDGKTFFVSWHSGTWLLSSTRRPVLPAQRAVLPDAAVFSRPAALAWLMVEDPESSLPAGEYHLRRERGDMTLSSWADRSSWNAAGPSRPSSRDSIGLLDPGLRRTLAFLGLRDGTEPTASWLLLLRQDDESLSLPDSAVLYREGLDRFSLPGEGLARFLDLDLQQQQVDEWKVIAMNARSLAAAAEIASVMKGDNRLDGLEDALWVRPGWLQPLVARIGSILDAVPIVSRDEIQFWHDLAVALDPFLAFEMISLETGSEGRESELHFWKESPWPELPAPELSPKHPLPQD